MSKPLKVSAGIKLPTARSNVSSVAGEVYEAPQSPEFLTSSAGIKAVEEYHKPPYLPYEPIV